MAKQYKAIARNTKGVYIASGRRNALFSESEKLRKFLAVTEPTSDEYMQAQYRLNEVNAQLRG